MPTVRTQDAARGVKRYMDKTAASGQDWVDGVKNPRRDQKAATLAAVDTWKKAIQEAIAADAFRKGVQAFDSASIDRAVDALGGSVYTQGIAARAATIEPKIAAAIADSVAVAAAVRTSKPATTLEERIARSAEYMRQRAAKAKK